MESEEAGMEMRVYKRVDRRSPTFSTSSDNPKAAKMSGAAVLSAGNLMVISGYAPVIDVTGTKG